MSQGPLALWYRWGRAGSTLSSNETSEEDDADGEVAQRKVTATASMRSETATAETMMTQKRRKAESANGVRHDTAEDSSQVFPSYGLNASNSKRTVIDIDEAQH